MAVAVRASNFAGINYGGSATPAWPAGTTTGDVVYAFVFNSANTLTVPSGFTQVGSLGPAKIYRHVFTVGDTAPTWTHSAGSDQWDIAYLTISGLDTTTPEDNTPATGYQYPTTTLALPNVQTAATSGGLILYLIAGFGASSTTSGTGLTAQVDKAHIHVLTAVSPGAGTQAGPTVTFSASQSSISMGVIALPVRPSGARIYEYGPTTATTAAAPAPGGRLVRSPDNTQWLPETKSNVLLRPSTAYLRGPNVFSGCKHYPNAVTTPQLTTRRQHVALFDGVDPVFVFGNVQNEEQVTGLGQLTISAVLEIANPGDASPGAIQGNSGLWRLTFGGQPTVTIPPGAYVKSDPIPLHLQKNHIYYTRTFCTVPGGAQIPVQALYVDGGRYETSDSVTTTDSTGNSGTALSNNTPVGGYGPQAVEATPFGRALLPMVVGMGDSIMEGVPRGNLRSWFDQVFELALVPHLKLSMSGEQAIQFFGQPGTINESMGRRYRGRFVAGATDIVSNYSINDISSSATFANMQSRVLAGAAVAAYYGARFHQTTLTPHTSSTDLWATLANQTPVNAGQETARTQTNAWLRDGAPINGTTRSAVATGDASTTTIRAGAYGHPIAGIFDAAAAVEMSNGTSLVWQVNAQTGDGLHPGDSGHNMIATAFASYAATRFAPYAT